MGKARQIRLDTRLFFKAGDASAFFSGMLNRYSIGQRVSAADQADLEALLKRHDERVEKIGIGINYIEVSNAPDEFGGRCFWIVRTDGSRIDFSFKHCLAPKAYDVI